MSNKEELRQFEDRVRPTVQALGRLLDPLPHEDRVFVLVAALVAAAKEAGLSHRSCHVIMCEALKLNGVPCAGAEHPTNAPGGAS